MPDFTLKVRGDTRDVQSGLNQAASSAETFAQTLAKGQAVAAEYARSVTLTSKEASALGRSLNLTAGEAKKLVAAEKLTADEAKKLAQAEMQASAQTKSLKESASSAAGSLQTLVAGLQAVAGAAIVQKIAEVSVELISMADAASDAREGLDLMTGAQADAYIQSIQTATRGTVSEMDAAAAAQHLFATGLVETADQAGEVVRVAARLGEAFGHMDLDTSIRQFEALASSMEGRAARKFGIDIGLAKERAAELMAATPGLTQEMANLTAILEQGSQRANQLDQTLDGADLAMQQSAAAGEDMKVALGEMVTEALTPAIQGARNLVVGIRDLRNATRDYHQEAAATSDSAAEYADQLLAVGFIAEDVASRVREGRTSQEEYNAAVENGDMVTANAILQARGLIAQYEEQHGAALNAAEAEYTRIEAMRGGAFWLPRVTEETENEADAEQEAADAQREHERAIQEATRAMQDQLREQQAMIGIAQQAYETIGTMGVQAYQDNAASGQAFLDALRASGNELRLTGDALNQYLLAQGMLTPQQLAFASGAQSVMDALSAGNLSIQQAIDLWALLEQQQFAAVDSSLAAATAQDDYREAMDLAAGRAVESSATVAGAQQQVADQAQAIADAQATIQQTAEPAFGAIVENAPAAVDAMSPLSTRFSTIVSALTIMPTLAAESFAAVNEAAMGYVGGDSGIGMAAALVASMRSSWQYLLEHPHLNLSATVEQAGAIPGAAGGASFVTRGPMLLMVGDNPGGAEHVEVTPLSGRGATHGIPGGLAMAGGGAVSSIPDMVTPGSQGPLEVVLVLDGEVLARKLIDPTARELRARGMAYAHVA